jgi:hypothetical protein
MALDRTYSTVYQGVRSGTPQGRGAAGHGVKGRGGRWCGTVGKGVPSGSRIQLPLVVQYAVQVKQEREGDYSRLPFLTIGWAPYSVTVRCSPIL